MEREVFNSSRSVLIKNYLTHLNRFYGIQPSFVPILIQFIKQGQENADGGMTIYLNGAMKSDVAQRCDVSLSRVDQALTLFVKNGYLERMQSGKYRLNPDLFGTSRWSRISGIKAVFDYQSGTVKMRPEFEKVPSLPNFTNLEGKDFADYVQKILASLDVEDDF